MRRLGIRSLPWARTGIGIRVSADWVSRAVVRIRADKWVLKEYVWEAVALESEEEISQALVRLLTRSRYKQPTAFSNVPAAMVTFGQREWSRYELEDSEENNEHFDAQTRPQEQAVRTCAREVFLDPETVLRLEATTGTDTVLQTLGRLNRVGVTASGVGLDIDALSLVLGNENVSLDDEDWQAVSSTGINVRFRRGLLYEVTTEDTGTLGSYRGRTAHVPEELVARLTIALALADAALPGEKLNFLNQAEVDRALDRSAKRLTARVLGTTLVLILVCFGIGEGAQWMLSDHLKTRQLEFDEAVRVHSERIREQQSSDRLRESLVQIQRARSSQTFVHQLLGELASRRQDSLWLEHLSADVEASKYTVRLRGGAVNAVYVAEYLHWLDNKPMTQEVSLRLQESVAGNTSAIGSGPIRHARNHERFEAEFDVYPDGWRY